MDAGENTEVHTRASGNRLDVVELKGKKEKRETHKGMDDLFAKAESQMEKLEQSKTGDSKLGILTIIAIVVMVISGLLLLASHAFNFGPYSSIGLFFMIVMLISALISCISFIIKIGNTR